MKTVTSLKEFRWPLGIVLGLTFFSFIISPAYMVFLRHRLERQLPSEWAKVTNNGPFTYVSSFQVTARNIEEGVYAIKVKEILRHGFPYDPHTGDRSLKSWLFDCMMFYPLAPFAWLTHGNVQYGWMLAHAVFGTLWVLFFFALFFHYHGDAWYALLSSLFSFFALDSFLWIPNILSALLGEGHVFLQIYLFLTRSLGQVQFVRLPSPGMTYLWVYLALAGGYRLASSAVRRPWAALAVGVSTGALCLAHFYEWGFAVGSLFFLLAMGLSRMEKADPGRWNLVLANGVSLLISAVYYLSARSLTQGVMADIIERVGAPHVRHFMPASPLYLAFSYYFWLRSHQYSGPRQWIWISAAAQELAVFLCLNASLVLGYDMQFGHFAAFGGVTAVLAFLCLAQESEALKMNLRPHAAVLIAALFAWVFLREKSWADTHYKIFGVPRDVASAARWVDENVPKDSSFMSLSGILTEYLPLEISMRWPVANGSPSYGSPISTEYNCLGLARILKTLNVNSELFLRERLDHNWDWDALKQQKTYLNRNLSWEEAQHGTWNVFLFSLASWGKYSPTLRPKIIKWAQEVQPLDRPFYLWLQSGEEVFLKKSPESQGGRLIYQNPSVHIYLLPKKSFVNSKTS